MKKGATELTVTPHTMKHYILSYFNSIISSINVVT